MASMRRRWSRVMLASVLPNPGAFQRPVLGLMYDRVRATTMASVPSKPQVFTSASRSM
jgi:hypothetical protein